MNRNRLRTIIIVFVSMLIITGAGMFTSILLDNMEKNLLSQTGKTLVRQAGIRQSSDEDDSGTVTDYTGEVKLSMNDRYKILCSWADADKSILHEPMNYQLKKTQAISIGKKWVQKLIKKNYILLDSHENDELTVEYADLSTVYYSIEVEEEELLSMWNISYAYGEENRIIVTIHAMTGEVWRTLATTYTSKEKWQKDEYEDIIRDSYDYIFRDDEKSTDSFEERKTNSSISISEDSAYAQLEREKNYDMMKSSGNIDISKSGSWLITEYENEYYSMLDIFSEDKKAKNEGDDKYYMQTLLMEHNDVYDIGFRLSKAEQFYDNRYFVGFEMLMLPSFLSNEIVEGFNVYSPIYDK